MKPRKEAPNAVIFNPFVARSHRLKIEKDMDAKHPEYKHQWKKGDTDTATLEALGLERVTDAEGKPIENGISVLCRQSREVWDGTKRDQSVRTLRQLGTIRNEDGSLTVKQADLVKKRNEKAIPEAVTL